VVSLVHRDESRLLLKRLALESADIRARGIYPCVDRTQGWIGDVAAHPIRDLLHGIIFRGGERGTLGAHIGGSGVERIGEIGFGILHEVLLSR
jgi:hypothetical protein